MENKKALVGMSGGVDSSVAAYLMLRQGYDCTGVTMRLYDNPTEESTCCSLDDVEDARAVAARFLLLLRRPPSSAVSQPLVAYTSLFRSS